MKPSFVRGKRNSLISDQYRNIMCLLEWARILPQEYFKDCGQGSEAVTVNSYIHGDELLSEVTMEAFIGLIRDDWARALAVL